MSRKSKKRNAERLWVIETRDRFSWSDTPTQTEPMSEADALAKYNDLTDNGTKKCHRDKDALTYYSLVPLPVGQR